MSNTQATEQYSNPPNLGVSLLGAIVVAALVLVIWVLPAEYNLDPLGTGSWLGLDGLAGSPKVDSHQPQSKAFTSDVLRYQLTPFASVEYKYKMQQGQTLVYQWQASGELVFDLHSEEHGSDPDDATSFSVGRSAGQTGSYTAPYTGIHGWFWENRGNQTVDFTLATAGFLDGAILYEGGFAKPHKLIPLLEAPTP